MGGQRTAVGLAWAFAHGPGHCSTGCCTMPSSSRSTAQAISCVGMPICSPSTSGPKP
jgi:hypothetical protein